MLIAAPALRITFTDRRLLAGYAVVALAAVIGVVLLPRALVNADEYYYAGQARTIMHGRALPIEGDPLPVPFVSPRRAAKYPPGWPAVLAIGRAVSFRAMFVVALAIHLIGGVAVARMLLRRGAPAWLNLVYVFHPVCWTFSQTLLSDVPTAVALLVAMDAWEDGRTGVSGAALGFACLTRLAAVFSVGGFVLAVVTRDRKGIARTVAVAACGAVGLGALMLWNHTVYGRALTTDYATGNQQFLSGRLALENAGLYGFGLLALPPFSGLWVLTARKRVDRWAIMAVPILAFFVMYAFHDASPNPVLTLVGGQRLVLTAHASLLVATAPAWSGLAPLNKRWVVTAFGAGLAVAASLVLRRIEAPHRRAAEAALSCAPGSIAYNMNAVRAAAAVEASDYFLVDGRASIPRADVAILATRTLSQNPSSGLMHYAGPYPTRGHCVAIGDYLIFDLSGRCELHGKPCDQSR